MLFFRRDVPPRLGLEPMPRIAPEAVHTLLFQDSYSLQDFRWDAHRSPRLLQKESQRYRQRDAEQKRLKSDLIMFWDRFSARNTLHNPSENRPKQSAEGKTEKIHQASCCAVQLRRMCFLDNRVRDHRGSRRQTGHKADDIGREAVGVPIKNP